MRPAGPYKGYEYQRLSTEEVDAFDECTPAYLPVKLSILLDQQQYGLYSFLPTNSALPNLTKSITLSPAQIRALNVTPQIIIPAPGPNIAILFNKMIIQYKYMGTEYDNVEDDSKFEIFQPIPPEEDFIIAQFKGGDPFLTGTAPNTVNFLAYSNYIDASQAAPGFFLIPNKPLSIKFTQEGDTSPSTVNDDAHGNGILRVTVFYNLINTNAFNISRLLKSDFIAFPLQL